MEIRSRDGSAARGLFKALGVLVAVPNLEGKSFPDFLCGVEGLMQAGMIVAIYHFFQLPVLIRPALLSAFPLTGF